MKINMRPPTDLKINKKIYIGLLAVFGFFVLLMLFSSLIVNVQWAREVGYLRTYLTRAIAVAGLTLPIFLIFYSVGILYYRNIIKKYDSITYPRKSDKELRRRNMTVYIFMGLFLAFLSFGTASGNWHVILQFFNSVDFNVSDPIFGHDVSLYVFRLPFYRMLLSLSLTIVVFLILMSILVYLFITAKFSVNRYQITNLRGILHILKNGFIQFAGKSLAMLIAFFMVLLGVKFYLDGFDILYSQVGVVYGPGFTDVRVNLPFLWALAGVSILAGFVVAYGIIRKKMKLITYPVVAIFLLSLLRVVTILGVQGLVVNPNELELERTYIQNNINLTRTAFNIREVDVVDFDADTSISVTDMMQNQDVLDSIKVTSYRQTLDFIKQTQVIRYYYDFNDVDVDRYVINGEKKQVFLSGREIDYSRLTPATWQNLSLFYTHGYGVIMTDASSITSQGQPEFLMRDIPTTNLTDIPLENPRIYFGELASDYVIINTEMDEFDYPRGGDNVTYRYTGDAGIRLGFFNKLLYAIHEQEPKILISSLVNSDSRIIRQRNIIDRVNAIAPFLFYDEDPYLVISEGSLYWIIDAYTYTDRYPNATPYNGINYLSNAVKVTIDAYDGTVNFYISDPNDPIIRSYDRIFGGMFKELAEMPEDLLAHIKYPEEFFVYQTEVLQRYHVTNPNIFYYGEDIWEKSKITTTALQSKTYQDPYSLFTSFEDSEGPEMVFTEYFTIKGKENMVSIVSARMDGDKYGRLIKYTFPPQRTISSPYLFRNKLNQDVEISKELSLLDSRGSSVEFGDIVITPIENSLLYVVPIYLIAEGENAIPEVKRVIVSNDEQIVIADNLQEALLLLFGFASEDPDGGGGTIDSRLAIRANTLFKQAVEAQQRGDWASYGMLLKELEDVLEQMLGN